MTRTTVGRRWLLTILVLVSGIGALAAEHQSDHAILQAAFAGTFVGEKLTVEWAQANGGYAGTIKLQDQVFPATAHPGANGVEGTFRAGTDTFTFTAQLQADTLTLVSGATTYTMQRVVNPLAAAEGSRRTVVGLSPTTSPATPTTLPATLVLKPAKMFDRMLGCDGYTILIPAGWKLQGDLLWNPWRTAQQMLFEQVTSPDGSFMIHYPVWQYHSEVGAKTGTVDTRALRIEPFVAKPLEYLQRYVFPESRKELLDAAVVSVKDVTDSLAKGVTPPQGGGFKCERIRLEFQREKIAYEEDFFCALVWLGPPSLKAGQEQDWFCVCKSFCAPRGRLEKMMPMFTAIDQSRTFDEHWFAVMTERQQIWRQNYQRFLQAQVDEMMKQAAIRANATRQFSDAQRAAWRQDQAARETSSTAFRQYIGDVDGYKSPYGGGQVELPSGYSHAFMSSDGRVIMTNDHAYEPPKDAATEWRTMDKGQ